ncbi:uroporphyrinogen-III C-methyltransferase [Microbacterium protaetiae]|uniref:uroporphyrinogen-III C-methyltransferase n=1 Tax=Microbacterium protaetiae TaxID=2509458 RepID=A0A4P6EGV7_9MICO|nr:uroporphyrinogen-III C-methyltransferase [Microbacterium protaetiae]QAY61146.1 uroporphyrinogen-III C-methyltransferase [Microbacterium protaetiae]
MTTLLGLSLAGRTVLFVGGGALAARRLHRFLAEDAVVRIIAPVLHPDVAELAAQHDLDCTRRAVRAGDLDDVWLVHTATGDPRVDSWVAGVCEQRRILCVNASDGSHGTVRLAAETRAGDSVVGVVSDSGVDPGRSVHVRDQIADALRAGRMSMRRHRPTGAGRVSLVGGGPGAADLMTVRGRMLLAEADVVIADRLGPTEVLDELPADVEIVDVGKRPGHHPVPQQAINALLVEHARAGRHVVRLKGGDPFVFGRGGEEVAACLAAGVAVDVVPGVSSALAVPQAAGIPVTHRGVAAAVHIVNGQADLSETTLAALADARTTTVILMGVAALPRLIDAAVRAGVPMDRPVAIVERGHTAHQRITRSTVGEVVADARAVDVHNPAVIVVGEVTQAGLLLAADVAAVAA